MKKKDKKEKTISPYVEFKPTKKHQKEKIEQAIILLNDIVKIRLAPSPIHGIGVFAMRNIPKGQHLYLDAVPHAFDVPFKDFKKLEPEIRELLLGQWPQVVNGSHFLYPVTKMNAYLNHSDEPNFDNKNDLTLKRIKAGEEITEDYRKIDDWEKIFTWLK